MTHLHPLVERTSPKGEPFLGKCPVCGKDGITFEMLPSDACLAPPYSMTREDAIVRAVLGKTDDG